MNDKNANVPYKGPELKATRISETAQLEGVEQIISTEQRKFKHFIYPALIFLLGVSISVFLYYGATKIEDDRLRSAFEEQSFNDITSAVVNELRVALSAVQDIESFFAASEFVSRQEFSVFVGHELEENKVIQALEWIPNVSHEEREAYEAAAREDGLLDFQFTERHSQGDMVPRQENATYFPVYYIDPLLGNEAAAGFDLASNPARLAALELARDTGEMVASAPIMLVQEQGQQAGFLVFLPIYKAHVPDDTVADRRANLKGFALGVFRTGDLLTVVVEGLNLRSIHIILYDIGDAAEPKKIFEHQPDPGDELLTSLAVNTTIDVAGRPWLIEFTAHSSFSKPYKTSLPLTLLMGGIILTSLVSYAFFTSEKQRYILDQSRAEKVRVAEELSLLVNTANALIVVTNMDGRITKWNQACEKILGYTKEEANGAKLLGFIVKENRSESLQIFARLQRGESASNFELRMMTKDGKKRIVLVNASLLHNKEGNMTGSVFIGQDITELDQYRNELEILVNERTNELNLALQELKELNQLKTEFLSTAAHELRTPLTSIMGFSEILLTRQIDEERQTRFMTMIKDEATHLSNTIDDLLDISRLEAGRGLEIASEPIDMANLMNEVIPPFVETNPKHQFLFKGLQEYPPLEGDPFRIAQVGKNIISNAVKYSPEGGRIIIHSRVVEDHLEISVRDEGIGMTKTQQEHLFEKFYRADASNTSISGTGLGLVISKTIIELHGGKIWIESEAGVGTTVFIWLPLIKK